MVTGDFKNGTALTGGVLAQQQVPAVEASISTVPASTYVKLAKVVLCNTSASAVTVSLSLVKSGGTGGASNRAIASWPLGSAGASTSTVDVTELAGALAGPGDFISAVASAATSVAVTVSGAVSA
jgi:hypothetical protein